MLLKRILISLLAFCSIFTSLAQIGIGTTTPETSSKLDLFSTSRGFLPPRMTKAQRDAINGGTFAEGLVIYNTDDNCLNFFNGTVWVNPCDNSGGTPPPNLPGNITLTGGQKAYVASVYDENYLPYTAATVVADTGSLSPDATTETLVDIQGTINTTTGLTVSIPYTVTTASVDLPAYSQTKTVIADHIQGANPASNVGGGTPIDVIFSYDAVTLPVGSGNVMATIKAVDNNLNAVKLDINKGIGTDLGILLAEFTIATNSSGSIDTIQLKDIPGIPDRRFGETTTQGNSNVAGQYHNNLYLPIMGPDGNIWLNNNLGSYYSNLNHSSFNLAQQAQNKKDENAFGSMYQWGRYSDGHELVNWDLNPDYNSSTHVNTIGTTRITLSTLSNKFIGIASASSPVNWASEYSNTLWSITENNPCPEGFKVPKESDWASFVSSINLTITNPAYENTLKLTEFGGWANYGNTISNYNTSEYWTSTIDNPDPNQTSKVLRIYSSGSDIIGYARAHGRPIRCIQHINAPTPVPANMTLSGNKISYIASINDDDYLPYTAPTGPANQQSSGDGSADDTEINVQGILTTTGQTISIPFTVTGTVNYDPYSYTVTVHDSLTQDGNGRQVNFSYPGGSVTTNGSITMTIKSVGGPLNLKKLDINNGLGDGTSIEGHLNSNVFGVLVAEAPILINDANDTNYVQLRNTSGIPDRRFGDQTTQGGNLGSYHNNLYLPVVAEDGKIWLNHQLGAIYTRTSNYDGNPNTDFNPAARPTSLTDFKAFGNYFQWGRYSDGHELVTFKLTPTGGGSLSSGSGVYYDEINPTKTSFETTTDKTLTSNQFVVVSSGSWHNSPSTTETLWTGEFAPNNPCPFGFRVPTHADYQNLRNSINWTSIGASPTLNERNEYFANRQIKWVFSSYRSVNSYFHGSYFTLANGYIFAGTSDQHSSNSGAVSHIYISPKNYWPAISALPNNNNKADAYTVRCIQHVEAPTPIPANMTLSGNKVSYIASINDDDYLPYTAPTGPANQQSSGDGSANDTPINVQGILTTTGQTISIPFTVTGTVNYDAYSYTVTVHDSLTQNGQGRKVNFSYPAGTASNNNGVITMTIKAIDQPLLLKKLDLTNGLGDGTSINGHINTNVFGILIAEVPILINNVNDTNYVQLRNISGIPDRRFGETSIQGSLSGQYHNNLYLPVTAADGKTWLNNNLGANYSDLTHPNENIAQNATSTTDVNAYGSYFQWGRSSDGHELCNVTSTHQNNTSSVNGVSINHSSTNTPGHNQYIDPSTIPSTDWRTSTLYDLWHSPSFENNPCPVGFKIPSLEEFENVYDKEDVASSIQFATGQLGIPSAGSRTSLEILSSAGISGWYWTSDNGSFARTGVGIEFNYSGSGKHVSTAQPRRTAMSVRCIQHIEAPTPIPANMTLSGNKVSYVASINDDDYLPYVAPTGPANQQSSGDGSADDTQVTVQGTLTTTGQTISIPFTVTGSVNYDEYSYTVTVHDSLTQNGQGRQVNFSYPAGSASSNGFITMTIKSIGEDLDLKQLDLNNGLGDGTATEGSLTTGVFGVLVAEVPILINDANDTNYIQLRNTAGIPDRNFGVTSTQNGVSGQYHNNLYLPVTAEDGRIWLNNNLGANYANTSHPQFNLANQATAYNDFNAYGSMFQWGRPADGHELVNFTGSAAVTPINATLVSTQTDAALTSPNHNSFITTGSATTNIGNWLEADKTDLWSGNFAINNPCPLGYRIATLDEWNVLNTLAFSSGRVAAAASTLKLSTPGFRENSNGLFISTGEDARYWSSVAVFTSPRYRAWNKYIHPTNNQDYPDDRALGSPVRCIQHVNAPTTIPANMTLSGNKISYIASVNDEDYLPYGNPTGPANLNSKVADGTNEATSIDIQGTLTTAGQTISIPYTSTGSVAYDAYDVTVTVHDSLTEDGNGRQVNFYYPAGTSSSPSGTITMTIKSVGGDLNLKKLDLNNGIGNGTSIEGSINSNIYGVFIAEVPIFVDNSNNIEYIQLRTTAGIPDRRFGETTTQGNPGVPGQYHNNLYLPVLAEDGSIWLNHELGAIYTRMFDSDGATSNSDFNPAAIPSSITDYKAYGNHFQWGRYSDGHELATFNSTPSTGSYTSTSFTLKNKSKTGLETTTDKTLTSNQMVDTVGFFQWHNDPTVNEVLWAGVHAPNNPCPQGFRIPTFNDYQSLRNSITWGPNVSDPANATYMEDNLNIKFVNSGQLHPTLPDGETYTPHFRRNNGYSLPATSDPHLTDVNQMISVHISGGNYWPAISNSPTLFSRKGQGHPVRCIQHVNAPTPIPAEMTLSGNKVSYLASVKDEDYMPYTNPTGPAKLSSKVADGTNETNSIEVAGTLTTIGQTIHIPYTSTSAVAYEAYDVTVNVHDSLTEDGNGGQVNFSYPGGTSTSPSGTITMTIKAIDGNLNLKKLDLNNGIGDGTSIEGNLNSNVFGVLVAEVPIFVDNANTTEYVQLRNMAGIPDRRFGEVTTQNGVSGQYHNNLYLPVLADDGEIWLNNNLGADYADATHNEFNIGKQAQNYNDHYAYGSKYQWGRYSDGHELMVYTAANAGSRFNSGVTTGPVNTDQPTTNQFITHGSSPNDWRQGGNDNLWQGATGINNPCPDGFKIPTHDQIDNMFTLEGISGRDNAYTSNLAFTIAGYSFYNSGALLNPGSDGYLWSSDISGAQSKNRRFNLNDGIDDFNVQRANAYSIRCIQHVQVSNPIPTNLTLQAGKTVWVPSIYDNDYLPYVGQPATASLGSLNPTGTVGNETLVNHQGTITTAGVTIKIPYSVSSGTADLDAFSETQTVPSNLIQGADPLSTDGGGATVDLILEYPAQTGLSGNGTITATIKAVGSTMNARKLDINNGIGQDLLGHLLAQFTLTLDNAGTTGNIDVRSIAGIPDRNFGQTVPSDASDNLGGLAEYHNSLYLPVTGLDNQVWLNNNLGANYSNINHANFGIATQAQTAHDVDAVGYLYQWGRKPDGHEIVGFIEQGTTDAIDWTKLAASENIQYVDPHATNGKFANYNSVGITPGFPLQTSHWTSSTVTDLWKDEDAQNNPCPHGFRVPTMSEIADFNTDNNINNSTQLFNSYLKMPTYAGSQMNGTINDFSTGTYTYNQVQFVSSETDPWTHNNASFLDWYSKSYEYNITSVTPGDHVYKNRGYSIRCIQD